MIYIALNLILAVFFICHTVYADRMEAGVSDGNNPVISNILIMAIAASLFFLLLCVRGVLAAGMFSFLIKVCFFLEGCMLVNVAVCFLYYAHNGINAAVAVVKYLLYAVILYLVIFRFREIGLSPEGGLVIVSDYIFDPDARRFFPWTWETVYKALFCYGLPAFCCLYMLVCNEVRATRLEKYKGYIYTAALIVMWASSLFIQAVAAADAPFSLLHFFAYPAMLIVMHRGGLAASAKSGRATLLSALKALFLFIVPAAALGAVYLSALPFSGAHAVLYALCCAAATAVLIFCIDRATALFSASRLGRTADYAAVFEKDLAAVDYSGEMDEIESHMFQIFNKNTECSFMIVFINGGQGFLETAYSSNGKRYSFSQSDTLFEELLNMDRNIVIYSELETQHSLAPVKDKLEKFFKDTESDALFILNEGRDVHGLILLGMKTSMDHYRDYDLQAFTKLYSYFFVFGYYMRNIANKEIIGTVNRELRMSSQIIASIQENIDPVENPKLDAGYIMVPAHNIGGEFVDMIRLTATRHLFVVGDLSGKGIAASMSMVILKSIIRSFLSEVHDFKQLVVKVNSFIRYNLQKGTIFAGMFAIVDFEKDEMYYINCGIPTMLLYTEAYNNVIEIQGSGHILGFVSDISPYISVKQTKFNRNDIVLVCTDGLIDSHSLRGEQYGKDRIQRNLVANVMYPAQRMARFAYDGLMKFMSKEMEDDVSVLVLKYLSANAAPAEAGGDASAYPPPTKKIWRRR